MWPVRCLSAQLGAADSNCQQQMTGGSAIPIVHHGTKMFWWSYVVQFRSHFWWCLNHTKNDSVLLIEASPLTYTVHGCSWTHVLSAVDYDSILWIFPDSTSWILFDHLWWIIKCHFSKHQRVDHAVFGVDNSWCTSPRRILRRYIGSGRRHWDGTGGSNGALEHFEEAPVGCHGPWFAPMGSFMGKKHS